MKSKTKLKAGNMILCQVCSDSTLYSYGYVISVSEKGHHEILWNRFEDPVFDYEMIQYLSFYEIEKKLEGNKLSKYLVLK